MSNLYTIYTPDEINIFKTLSPNKTTQMTATSKLMTISQKIPIFKGIPETILIKILKEIKILKYKKGEIIIKEGENDDRIFYILLGEVNVIKQNILLTTIQRNSIIGEMSGLLNQKRTASIFSANDTTTILSFKIDFSLNHSSLGYYFSIIYKNLSIELAKKILNQDNQLIKK